MPPLQVSFERTPLITNQELDDIFQGRAAHHTTLRAHDFPPELLIEIVSYLSRRELWRMIGINRMLFELGMNELYEEVRLMDCGRAGYKTFEQIGHQNIASRVQRLNIRPTFLPRMGRDGKAVYDKSLTTSELKSRKAQSSAFLTLALTSLRKCSHIRELTVVVQDQLYLTSAFAKFFHKLIKLVGAELGALTVDMTLPNFLSIHRAFDSKLLPKLSSLTIKITNTRFTTPTRQARRIRRALLNIITSLGSTLQSLAFEVIDCNLSKLFQKLQKLPPLRSLELRTEIGFSTLIPTIHFVSFLQRNASNLERLVIRRPTVDIPNSWNLNVMVSRLYDLLCIQRLPQLKELVLEMDYPVILTSLTSHLHTFVPHLRNLTLTGPSSVLDDPKLTSLLESLANCDKGLECLKISLSCFCPQHLDLIASFLPNLRKLDLTYEVLQASAELTGLGLTICEDDVYCAFRNREYGRWGLEELRLLEVLKCPQGHPDPRLLDAIADSLLSIKRITRARTCDCK
ncbi:hypothetical protein Agabi119p4_7558 [Agaricus bisporus var. burnettii]|uniref:F-box domain-containing protein n=1 Tax=Agaricus bisporus var. burnettii TaxID=192524 RepID=A0A8H7C8G1_AGABI|nr:hypothetical protein Agabi119p4_7558 [Agaricus bisporus var. burnettii]